MSWRKKEEWKKRGFGLALIAGERRRRWEAEDDDRIGRLWFLKKKGGA